jgi:uncharacterized membrane protein (UPF0182 family)
LQAENGQIPELKQVILATANRVVMAENLGLALARLFGEEVLTDEAIAELAAGIEPGESATGTTPGFELGSATIEDLILNANSAYERAQEFLRGGDWSGYGAEMEQLQTILTQLAQTTGIVLPGAITDTVPLDAETLPLEVEATATPE